MNAANISLAEDKQSISEITLEKNEISLRIKEK